MSVKNINTEKLKEILIKLANGFYYVEEQVEYQKPQKISKYSENSYLKSQNISFFDICDTDCTKPTDDDAMMKIDSYDEKIFKDIKDDSFSKKKITTHYIPPDISAIKMLFEIYNKEVNNNLVSSLSDNELLSLKNKLIKELTSEN